MAVCLVTLCGKLADAGGSELALDLPEEGLLAAALLALAGRTRPALQPQLGRTRVCVGETIVGDDHRVMPGDRIALFPPVSGG